MLVPGKVVPGLQIWRLVSYVFLSGAEPLGFLMDLFVLFFFAGWFERSYGPRRLLRFFLLSALGAGVFTTLVGLVSPGTAAYPYFGAWAAFEALTVAMGTLQPAAQVYFYMVIPVTARQLMYLSWGIIGLFVVFYHTFVPFLPAIGGVGMGFALTVGWQGPRRLWLRLQAARLERQLRRRAQHLRVVPKESGTSGDGKKNYLN
jgi:membrane associated rhomboid family serine protease